ncbi:WW domain-binding protein 2-like [Gigantopelta aegis]|uniref:WW domain-binding protein 2-like n=1 Tax=Gigantopelta aegis TaxID=1735272 RepID=UPI001B88C865|nr:WW domain-binding protein 2-like [Gigantopelta aegis]
MSLNTAHANGGVLIFAGERILIFYDGVEMAFEGPRDMPHFKGKKHGRALLTTHRVIFTSADPKDILQSFSIPFYTMRDMELEQPVFGANYIKGRVVAEQGGNWSGEAKFKMYFTKGGAIEFGQAMLRAGQLAMRNRPPQPPVYSPPVGNIYQAPPPAYEAPHTPYYDWVPYNTFPTAPPPNYVYTMEAPPPYPGVDPNMTPYPPPQANGSASDAKAREANASAYYNPANPHNVYMPAPTAPPFEPPPSYDQATKKTN